MKNWIIGFLALICVGLSGVSYSLKKKVTELEARAVAIEEVKASIKAEAEKNRLAREKAEVLVAESHRTDVAQAPVAPVELNQEEARKEMRKQHMKAFADRFNDPSNRLNMIDERQSGIDSQYSEFFKNSGLSLDQIDVLKTMLAEKDLLRLEGRIKSRMSDNEEEAARIQAELARSGELVDEEIAKLIGDDLAQELNSYANSSAERAQVDSLKNSLSYTDSPISDEQSTALVTALSSATQSFEFTKDLSQGSYRGNADISSEDVGTYMRERHDYDRLIIEQASTVLNEEQLMTFAEQQLANRDRERRRMIRMMERSSQQSAN